MLRCRSLLRALVLRACYVTARSWEPWCSELFTLPLALEPWCSELPTSPLALGSRGVKSCLRYRPLLEAFVQRACHVTELLGASVAQAVQSLHSVPTPRDCLRHRALGSLGGKSFLRPRSLLGALALLSVDGGSWGSSWSPFGALLEPFWGPFGPSWGPFGPSGGILEAFGCLGALLGASWGGLGGLLGLSWGSLGPSWGPLGPFSGASGGLLGRLGTISGASWAVFGRSLPDKAKSRKTCKNN